VVAAWLFVVGLYGIITSRHLVHLIVCLSVCQSSTYILLLAVGYRWGATAPIFNEVPVGTPAVDPVAKALTLTDVVVSAAVTALLLAMAIQAHKRFGTLDPDELVAMSG
jgi:multicomponent Na+:H+ antiporter subunit C